MTIELGWAELLGVVVVPVAAAEVVVAVVAEVEVEVEVAAVGAFLVFAAAFVVNFLPQLQLLLRPVMMEPPVAMVELLLAKSLQLAFVLCICYVGCYHLPLPHAAESFVSFPPQMEQVQVVSHVCTCSQAHWDRTLACTCCTP